MRRWLGYFAGTGLMLLAAGAASADDKDLLRSTGSAPPNLLIVFGNGQSMSQTLTFTGSETSTVDGDADSPGSKLGTGKRVIREFVLNRHSSYNIGLTTFAHQPNVGAISILQKHWLYAPITVDFPGEPFAEPIGTINRWGTFGVGPCTSRTLPACTDRSPAIDLSSFPKANFAGGPNDCPTCPFFGPTGTGTAYLYLDDTPNQATKRIQYRITEGAYGDAFTDGTLSALTLTTHSIAVTKDYQTRIGNGWNTVKSATVGYRPPVSLSADAFYTSGPDSGKEVGFLVQKARNDKTKDFDVSANCSGWEFQTNSDQVPLVKIPRDYKSGVTCKPPQDSFPCVKRLLRPQAYIERFNAGSASPYGMYDPDNPGYTGSGSKYADGCDPDLLGAVQTGLDVVENNAILTTQGISQVPIKNLLENILAYFSDPKFDGFKNGVRTDDPNAVCRNSAVILVYDSFDGCQNDNCNQLKTQVLKNLKQIGIPVYVIGFGASAAATSATGVCIARETGATKANGTDPGYFEATTPDELLQALEEIGSIVNEGRKGFVASTVSSAQSKGDQVVYLATFNAASKRSIWNGRINAYKLGTDGSLQLGKLTIRDPNDPFRGAMLDAPSNNPDSLKWNAGENLADTPGTGATNSAAVLRPGALLAHDSYDDNSNDPPTQPIATNFYPGRKIVFSLPQTYTDPVPTIPIPAFDAVPENRYDMVVNTTATWWPALKALMGPQTGPPFVRSPALDDPDASNALRFIWGDRDAVMGSAAKDIALYNGLKLGDIFHSSPVLVGPPNNFAYFTSNLNNYVAFRSTYRQRRRVLFFGANDGLFHAVDAGGFDRNPSACAAGEHCYDLGTGAELFAYAPRATMQIFKPLKDAVGPQTPRDEWTVDGPPTAADVFIDAGHTGTPIPSRRAWHTVLVGGAREGSPFEGTAGAAPADSYGGFFALDITQPDELVVDGSGNVVPAGPTPLTAPRCLNPPGDPNAPGDASCGQDASDPSVRASQPARAWPTVLWEITDVADQDASASTGAGFRDMGESWSKPALGRVKVCTANCDNTSAPLPATEDRYVAIFGGGFDRERLNRRGNWLYIVDVETGKVLYRANSSCGVNSGLGGCSPVYFGSVPSEPAAIDFNGDGYVDLLYFGDLKGRLWRIDLTNLRTLSSAPGGRWQNKIDIPASSAAPFLLFEAPQPIAPATSPFYPIYYRPTAVSLGYSVSGKPALGIGFGTGDRDDILATKDAGSLTYAQRIYYVVDRANSVTRTETDLYDIASSTAASTSTVPPNGWFIELGNGERLITDSISAGGILFFSTFIPPTAQSGSGACSNPNKCGSLSAGTSRLFRVSYATGNPYLGSDRAEVQQFGSFLSEPVYFQSQDQSGNIMYTTENTVKTEKAPGGKKTTVKGWKERSRRP